METTEVLISFNNTLIAEGVPDAERIERSAVLLHCIEHAETSSQAGDKGSINDPYQSCL